MYMWCKVFRGTKCLRLAIMPIVLLKIVITLRDQLLKTLMTALNSLLRKNHERTGLYKLLYMLLIGRD